MRFAYADPPYPGCAHRYPEKREVDHRRLILRLISEFPEGWALSTSSVALRDVLALCPSGVRIAAWVKPFASFKPNVNPAYAWEPVIFNGGRTRRERDELTVRDWFSGNITLKKGLVGAKSPEFCRWILDLLGYEEGDEMVDLYPGTGVMGRVLRHDPPARPRRGGGGSRARCHLPAAVTRVLEAAQTWREGKDVGGIRLGTFVDNEFNGRDALIAAVDAWREGRTNG